MDNQENYQHTQPQQQPPPQYPPPQYPPPSPNVGQTPGKGKAIVSLVLGIISIVMPIPILGPIVAIIGLVMASLSKKEGFTGGIRTGGLVCSIIGLIGGLVYSIIFFIAGAFFLSVLGATGIMGVAFW